MNRVENRERVPHRRFETLGLAGIAFLGILYVFLLVYTQVTALQHKVEFVPVSLNSRQSADYNIDPPSLNMPSVRIDIIQEVIHDQEPASDAIARFARVQANLLTPVAFQSTRTPTPSPTPTRILVPSPTPVPSVTELPTEVPTPGDPWLALGQWRVGCNTEISFEPVSAQRLRFQAISGGGPDNLASFYCCGSSGAAWLVNGQWYSVTNQSLILRVGESHELGDLGGAMASRMRFNVGCNDDEQVQVKVSYMPAASSGTSPTRTITSALGTTPQSTPSAIPFSPTPTSTSTATPTVTSTSIPTATPTPTATFTPIPSSTFAPTMTPIPTATPTPTATSTPTPSPTFAPTLTPIPTAPPTLLIPSNTPVPPKSQPGMTPTIKVSAPKGSIAYHKNENGIDRLLIFNLDTKTTTPLVDVGPILDLQLETHSPLGAWSPDNSRFAYVSTTGRNLPNALKVLRFDTGAIQTLFTSEAEGGISSPTWSSDGTQIAFIHATAYLRAWAVAIVNVDRSRCSAKVECEILKNSQGEQYRGGLSWSKPGVFALASNVTGANRIYSMFVNGADFRNLTSSAADDRAPAWSPDGKSIAFTSARDGFFQIYVMNSDGSEVRRISRGNAADLTPTWSPDGHWIAFASDRGGRINIYMMDLNGNQVTQLTTDGGDYPAWSH
jgi:Tol biopolymer transport system component